MFIKVRIPEYNEWFHETFTKVGPHVRFWEIPKSLYDRVKEKYDEKIRIEEIDITFVSLNNKGIVCEKEGKIEEAIEIYEKAIALGVEGSSPFERLRIIYRKRKDYENMQRVIRRWAEVYGYDSLWVKEEIERLMPQKGREKPQQIYPTSAHPYIVNGKTFEERFYEIKRKAPEFDFYANHERPTLLGLSEEIVPREILEAIWELKRTIKSMIQEAEGAEKKGRLDAAAQIYEKLVGNGVHETKPYERLHMIYKKAKLAKEAKGVLERAVGFFSKLRESQFKEVMQLAQKYNVTTIEGTPIAEYGKIMYFYGLFDLYNPYPVIERWKEKLTKL